jgi:hypothetical protein
VQRSAPFEHVGSLAHGHRQRAGIPVAELVVQDLRYGLQRLRRQPGATLLIGATLGLGVGANAAMLNLMDLLGSERQRTSSIRSASSTSPARAAVQPVEGQARRGSPSGSYGWRL